MNRNRTLLHIIFTSLSLAVFLTTLVVGTGVLIDRVEYRISELRGTLLDELEATISQEIRWDSINPSILRGLTVHGVEISDMTGRAQSVSIALRPTALLWGDPDSFIPAIVIRNPVLEIRTQEQLVQLERTIAFFRTPGEGRREVTISLENGRASLETAELGYLTVTDLFSETRITRNSIEGTVRGFFEYHRDVAGDPFELAAQVDARIDGSRNGDPFGATVTLERIAGSHFSSGDQSFRIERNGTVVQAERIRSQDALDIAARLDTAGDAIEVDMRSRQFVPASIVTFAGPWAHFNDWTSRPVTTESTIQLAGDGSFLGARGSFATRLDHADLPEPVSVAMEYRASPDRIDFPGLRITAERGHADFRGSWRPGTVAPSGTITFSDFSYAGSPRFEGSVVVSGSRDSAGLSVSQMRVNGIPVYHGTAHFRSGGGDSRYSSLEASLSLESDRYSQLRGNIRFADLTDFTGELEVIDLPLVPAAAAARALGFAVTIPRMAGGFRASGAVRFDQRNGSMIVRAPYLTTWDEKQPDRVAALSGDYRNGTLTISQYFVQDRNLTLVGSGTAVLYTDDTVTFFTDFSVNRVTYRLDGTYDAVAATLDVTGPYDFTAHLRRTAGGGIAISAGTQRVPLPLGNARLSARLEGVYFDTGNWYADIQEATLDNVPIPGDRVLSGTFAAALGPETVRLAITELTDGISTLAGTLDTRYWIDNGTPEFSANGALRSLETEEQYRVAARFADRSLALDLRFSESPVSRFTARADRGTVQGTIQAVGTLEDPEIRAYLESDRLVINGNSTRFRFLAQSDASVLRISEGTFGYTTSRLEIPQIIVDRQTGEINGEVRFSRLEREVDISFSGSTDPIPHVAWEELRAHSIDLFIQADSEESDSGSSPQAWQYRLQRTAEETRITRQDGAIDAYLTDTGEFRMTAGTPLPYQGVASGFLTGDRMEITVSDISVDLSELPLPPGLGEYSIDSGMVHGSLRLIGAPGDPDIFGTLAVQSLELATPFSPDRFGPVDTALIFEDKLIRLQDTSGRAGAAPVNIAARVLINRFALEQFEIKLDFPGETGVHVVSDFGPISVDGYGRGALQIAGTQQDILIDGAITVYGTELAVQPDFDPDSTDGPNATVDLTIRSGRAVRFIWPDTDLPILRSNVATGQQVSLQVDSRANTFALTGDVDIQSGDVFYFDRNFLIRNGKIEFRETQDDFDPRLTARAELREATPEGPVRIYLIADGQRLSEFSPRFESNPPLDGNEIVAILGGNILPGAGTGAVTLPSALLSTTDIVTRFGFFRQFENNVRDQLDLDLFAIRTSVIQNILLTAINPVDEDAVQQITPSLGTYLNNTSIFMGRYIGDSVFGQLVLQMRSRDPEVFPDDDGIQRFGGVLIDSEISLEWQTPFFLLEWNFAPQNPEELFIRDNTFSFLWSFSY